MKRTRGGGYPVCTMVLLRMIRLYPTLASDPLAPDSSGLTSTPTIKISDIISNKIKKSFKKSN